MLRRSLPDPLCLVLLVVGDTDSVEPAIKLTQHYQWNQLAYPAVEQNHVKDIEESGVQQVTG
jgi:hypothetical protein